jgi:NADH:ubiquinone oxidoreductase subunit 6 (subunit J)
MRTAYRLSTAIGNLSCVEVVICHSNPMAPDCRCLDVFCIVWGYDTLVHSLFSDAFIWFYMVSRLLWILLYIVMNYRLLLALQSVDFERTWRRLFQKRVVCTKLDIYVFIIRAFSLVLKMIDIKLTRNKHLRIDMANIISRIGSSISKLYVLIGCLNAFISHF